MAEDMLKDIESKVQKIIDANKGEDLSPEGADLEDGIAGMGINSINIIRIIVALEDEFGFEFDIEDFDFERFKTLTDLAQFIQSQIKN